MLNKKTVIIFAGIFLFLIAGIISAQTTSYCCEKTVSGAWCQNAPEEECNPSFRSVPTSCEATSYCKLGTCVNSGEGTCIKNTPRIVCENEEGVWYEQDKDELSQCQLGCCLMGDQAAYVTQTRCKKLSSIYGLETNFQASIKNELTCIASATPDIEGACVIEEETGRTCRFITKKECQEIGGDFNEGFLCSAEELGADCGPRGGTTCVEGRDAVYFLDTCGNLANVYDYSLIDDTDYWTYIQPPECGDGDGNKNSETCGLCDYYAGSTCGEGNAKYKNYICQDLGCEWEGEKYEHGESWCVKASASDTESEGHKPLVSSGETTEFSDLDSISLNNADNIPGNRDFRLLCYNGEVMVEPCADYRQEVCVQGEVGSGNNAFKSAVCKTNLWRDCYSQDNKKDCENTDKRDCVWIKGISILTGENGEELIVKESGTGEDANEELVVKEEDEEGVGASCVPKYTPGFDFWKENTEAADLCSIASVTCTAYFEKGVSGEIERVVTTEEDWFGKREDAEIVCFDKSGELVDDWIENRIHLCSALGDCGLSVNYVGGYSYYDKEDLYSIIEEDEESSESSSE